MGRSFEVMVRGRVSSWVPRWRREFFSRHDTLEFVVSYIPVLQNRSNWLLSTKRPIKIGQWFKMHRPYDKQPDLADSIPTYRQSWWAWWELLQPTWQKSFATDVPLTADWSCIAKGGQNGIFVVVLSVGWWLVGIRDAGAVEFTEFSLAFNEVMWVLGHVRNSLRGTNLKRVRDEDGPTRKGRSKRYMTFCRL